MWRLAPAMYTMSEFLSRLTGVCCRSKNFSSRAQVADIPISKAKKTADMQGSYMSVVGSSEGGF